MSMPVAPRVGARVEMVRSVYKLGVAESPRGEGRELRLGQVLCPLAAMPVAPRVGARVEIYSRCNLSTSISVAPRVGARVEIHYAYLMFPF